MLKLVHRQITKTEVKKFFLKWVKQKHSKGRPQMITDVKTLNRQCQWQESVHIVERSQNLNTVHVTEKKALPYTVCKKRGRAPTPMDKNTYPPTFSYATSSKSLLFLLFLNCNTNSFSRRLGGRLFTLPATKCPYQFSSHNVITMSLRLALQFQKQNIQIAARTRTKGWFSGL